MNEGAWRPAGGHTKPKSNAGIYLNMTETDNWKNWDFPTKRPSQEFSIDASFIRIIIRAFDNVAAAPVRVMQSSVPHSPPHAGLQHTLLGNVTAD